MYKNVGKACDKFRLITFIPKVYYCLNSISMSSEEKVYLEWTYPDKLDGKLSY